MPLGQIVVWLCLRKVVDNLTLHLVCFVTMTTIPCIFRGNIAIIACLFSANTSGDYFKIQIGLPII
jgi:hypothetical protein